MWRFHKVHHSAEHLDWLAAHREHPLDSIYTIGLINLPAFIFGFDLETIAAIVAFRGIWAIYIHSNVRLPLGLLKKIIGSPELHHWHHDLKRDRGNYANLSPLMDILFGTYTSALTTSQSTMVSKKNSLRTIGAIAKANVIWLVEGKVELCLSQQKKHSHKLVSTSQNI